MYDIVGDIHGYYELLVKLLLKMGYVRNGSTYHHSERKIIFTGDIINRGPDIRKSLMLVRSMVESGDAQMVLGNHEMSAILYFTLDKTGKTYFKHLARYSIPLLNTQQEFSKYSVELEDYIKWFRTLPFSIDLGKIRIVHACWDEKHLSTINENRTELKLKRKFLNQCIKNTDLALAVNEVVKGKEFQMPSDLIVRDSKGLSQRRFRMKWWEQIEGETFQSISFGNRFKLPAYTVPKEILPTIEPYPVDAPIVFFGHYCLENSPNIIRDNLCCVDSCVARTHRLTAYRWSGETKLKNENLIHVSL